MNVHEIILLPSGLVCRASLRVDDVLNDVYALQESADAVDEHGVEVLYLAKPSKTALSAFKGFGLVSVAPVDALFAVDPRWDFQETNAFLRSRFPAAFEWMEKHFHTQTGQAWDVEGDESLWRVLQAEVNQLGVISDPVPRGSDITSRILGKTKVETKLYICTLPASALELELMHSCRLSRGHPRSRVQVVGCKGTAWCVARSVFAACG